MKNKTEFLAFNILFSSLALSMESGQAEQKSKEKLSKKLIQACNKDKIERVKELIELGADVNAKYGKTALTEASFWGRKEIAELLISSGADVNAQDDKCTPLMYACFFDHKEIVKLLIDNKADVNAKDNNGWTVLINLSERKNSESEVNKEIVELLIRAGADVNTKDEVGWTALNTASYSGNKEIMRLLIKSGADLNAKDEYGRTALYWANYFSRVEIAELLHQIVNNFKNEVYKAIDSCDKENFKKYILKIGTICFRDKNGNNLLHYAMKTGNLEFTKIIYGIKPELIAQVNNSGGTPLSFIGANGNFIELFRNLILNQNNN